MLFLILENLMLLTLAIAIVFALPLIIMLILFAPDAYD